jgi:hypothetical protein
VLDEESHVIGVVAEDIRTGVLSTEGAANPGAFDYPAPGPDVFDVLARFPID